MSDDQAPADRPAERRDLRLALLEAAVASLLELGFARTTTLEVQRRAGVSRGALLHHFPSKAELLVATIEHLAWMRGRDLKERTRSLPAGDERIDAALDLLWECFGGPLFQVTAELTAVARTEPELGRALIRVEIVVHDRIRRQASELFGPAITSRPGYDHAFDLTLHLMIGAASTAMLHGAPGRARADALIARWKTHFPMLLAGTPGREKTHEQ
ncbi:MAG: TetR/AcrR family transcriptional regulator [Deltaproteobacteria bacterium]|nr:TetR/AcrR family transcriptional regulator [Deltaproteobacteria bacterium]